MKSVKEQITDILSDRIVVLDGALGTVLQGLGLSGNSEAFNVTHPDLVRSVHESYIAAGSDIITTNSFGANAISQSAYGMSERAAKFALAAARIAREAADAAPRRIWVAGSVGPTGKSLTLAPDLSRPEYRPVGFDELSEAYEAQISALVEGGVDLILLETCFDALNAKAAISALSRVAPEIPVVVSVSVSDRSGRTLTGQTLEAFYTSVKHANLLAFGINCSFGASDLEGLLESVESSIECAVSFYPNAGLPNELGQYDENPQKMASAIGRIARKGLVNIVGGCCGSTADHIRAVAESVRGLRPRPLRGPAPVSARLTVSGLECAAVDSRSSFFTNVGERTNVSGSRKFARLIASGSYEEALQVAAGQIDGGASIIDVNLDDAMLDSTVEMERFLRYISNDPSVAKAALMIDSSHFETILAGLKNAQGKCIVNSISLKEGEAAFLEKAARIKSFGAAMVVMAFDEEGQATTYERKISIAQRAYRLLTEKVGVAPSDIIFDVNVLSIGTGIAEHARYGVDFIEAVRWIRENLPGALTSGGISNLSFAFRGNNPVREAMHSAFLYHATAAGLDMGIVNPSMLQVYDSIEPEMLKCVEDVIFDRDPEATERLIEKAQRVADVKPSVSCEAAQEPAPVSVSVESRLSDALVRGRGESLRQDVLEALEKFGTAVDVIEGPLMDGMKKVGEYFGEGKMFLPQVVKSARIMRDAVDILQPYLETGSGNEGLHDRPKVVIATVKGDVHDIGKNITSIVLTCNGFDVIDLGVMVPEEVILDEAERVGAAIVAASGLITPSLARMEDLCRKMAERGMTIPLFIGGATTSALHTAVKLAPLYGHVYYGPDASASAVMAKRFVSDPEGFERDEHEAQGRIRALYQSRESVPAGSSRGPLDLEQYLPGSVFEDIEPRQLSVDEVLPYFDWRMLYSVWGFRYGGNENDETRKLRADAEDVLEYMKRYGMARITIAARFVDCVSEGDDIVWDGGRLPMMRQEDGEGRSLADFVVPAGNGFTSQMGLFAISVHRLHHGPVCDCGCGGGDGYDSMLERSVRLTLAEAASAWLDAKLGKEIPGGREGVRIVKPAAGYASCPDHTLKRDILGLLPDSEALGISFTESYAMVPDASICGLIFAGTKVGYPEIRRSSRSAVDKYAARRGMSDDEKRMFLSHLLPDNI